MDVSLWGDARETKSTNGKNQAVAAERKKERKLHDEEDWVVVYPTGGKKEDRQKSACEDEIGSNKISKLLRI